VLCKIVYFFNVPENLFLLKKKLVFLLVGELLELDALVQQLLVDLDDGVGAGVL